MCYPNLTALKFVAISNSWIFIYYYYHYFILLKICFPLQKKLFFTITPPKHMQINLIFCTHHMQEERYIESKINLAHRKNGEYEKYLSNGTAPKINK